MELILVRHGNKKKIIDYNPDLKRSDPPLTDLGKKQAEITGKFLKNNRISNIYASDTLRTKQTASIISKILGKSVEFRKELRELHFGLLETQGWNNFSKIAPDIYEKYCNRNEDFYYPQGENGETAYGRLLPSIKAIIEEQPKRALIVAHGGIIRVLLCGLLGIPFGNRFHLGNPIYNCSITRLHYNQNLQKFQLHLFNSVSHFQSNLISGNGPIIDI
ncbi:histidine phosphatase family protein [Promethearchaeum syntrophicum]|uniref:Histidine phosphatase family protein n=1 Tax=Promethearchaeum syntrophicum TaxID=2594042 RepID=A0A5B9DFY2_9ARCH|nr:histidine phosphatase family protein [Candidatus Prometheoarchaeum syntrophicum]QEE17955.1 phosphoglycerate mutase [Candidatus Prometheoarchaeum syntrophicum]